MSAAEAPGPNGPNEKDRDLSKQNLEESNYWRKGLKGCRCWEDPKVGWQLIGAAASSIYCARRYPIAEGISDSEGVIRRRMRNTGARRRQQTAQRNSLGFLQRGVTRSVVIDVIVGQNSVQTALDFQRRIATKRMKLGIPVHVLET